MHEYNCVIAGKEGLIHHLRRVCRCRRRFVMLERQVCTEIRSRWIGIDPIVNVPTRIEVFNVAQVE